MALKKNILFCHWSDNVKNVSSFHAFSEQERLARLLSLLNTHYFGTRGETSPLRNLRRKILGAQHRLFLIFSLHCPNFWYPKAFPIHPKVFMSITTVITIKASYRRCSQLLHTSSFFWRAHFFLAPFFFSAHSTPNRASLTHAHAHTKVLFFLSCLLLCASIIFHSVAI